MQIKQVAIRLSVLSALLMLWIQPARSYDVRLTVTGAIRGNTCTIATESKDIIVPLGKISDRQFSEVGAVGNLKSPFTIRLEQCGPTFEGAKLTFHGVADEHGPQYLKIDDGGATGVAVQIMDSNSAVIPLNSATSAYKGPGSENIDIQFYARLVATQLPVTSGAVSAMATWTIEYL